MNCKEACLLIAALTGDDLPATLAAHVRECPACADLLGADARFRATLRSHAPEASPNVLARIRQEIAPQSRTLPLGGGQGGGIDKLRGLLKLGKPMKITLSAAALVALALVSAPRAADAATPLATFAKMKKAVLAQARSMTSLDVKVGKTPAGSLGTWVVVDGELTPLGSGGTYHSNKDGKDITVTTSVDASPDLSSLSPEMRAKVQKAIQDAMSGQAGASVVTKYVVNGKEVDAQTAKDLMTSAGIDFKLSVDLDEDDYRAIAFGADHDHLVLSPKATKDRRTVVTLDPKSSLPRVVRVERNVKGRWLALGQKSVTLR